MSGKSDSLSITNTNSQSLTPGHLYYPAFLNLHQKQCIVVGGGKVAERKVLSLLRSGATVRVISPAITSVLKRHRDNGNIEHINRNYKSGDLRDAFLVIAATAEEEINREISAESSCLINVVDKPEMANFIVPSAVNRGPLTIAISTSGSSPAMARAIRKEIEILYSRDFGRYLSFLRCLRSKVIRGIADKKIRGQFLREIASKDIIDILRREGFKKTEGIVVERYRKIVLSHLVSEGPK